MPSRNQGSVLSLSKHGYRRTAAARTPRTGTRVLGTGLRKLPGSRPPRRAIARTQEKPPFPASAVAAAAARRRPRRSTQAHRSTSAGAACDPRVRERAWRSRPPGWGSPASFGSKASYLEARLVIKSGTLSESRSLRSAHAPTPLLQAPPRPKAPHAPSHSGRWNKSPSAARESRKRHHG